MTLVPRDRNAVLPSTVEQDLPTLAHVPVTWELFHHTDAGAHPRSVPSESLGSEPGYDGYEEYPW